MPDPKSSSNDSKTNVNAYTDPLKVKQGAVASAALPLPEYEKEVYDDTEELRNLENHRVATKALAETREELDELLEVKASYVEDKAAWDGSEDDATVQEFEEDWAGILAEEQDLRQRAEAFQRIARDCEKDMEGYREQRRRVDRINVSRGRQAQFKAEIARSEKAQSEHRSNILILDREIAVLHHEVAQSHLEEGQLRLVIAEKQAKAAQESQEADQSSSSDDSSFSPLSSSP